jgi:hypothetical protein
MLAPRALNTTKNPINFCSTYLSPVPKLSIIVSKFSVSSFSNSTYIYFNICVICGLFLSQTPDTVSYLSQEDSIMLLVTAAQMQELDQRTIKEFSIPGLILMENAGRGIFELICRHFAARLHHGVTILVGPGNNGGDGFVVARHLNQEGVKVELLILAQIRPYC